MAQDGSSQIDPQREKELRRQVEEKLGKVVSWQRHEDERDAKVRRQHSLEQAAGIVKSAMDWQDDGSTSREAGRAALELADRFYRWVDTGQLPTA